MAHDKPLRDDENRCGSDQSGVNLEHVVPTYFAAADDSICLVR